MLTSLSALSDFGFLRRNLQRSLTSLAIPRQFVRMLNLAVFTAIADVLFWRAVHCSPVHFFSPFVLMCIKYLPCSFCSRYISIMNLADVSPHVSSPITNIGFSIRICLETALLLYLLSPASFSFVKFHDQTLFHADRCDHLPSLSIWCVLFV